MAWGLVVPTDVGSRPTPKPLKYPSPENTMFTTANSWYDVGHILGLLNGGSDTNDAPYANFMPQVR